MDIGESGTIALSFEMPDNIMILDDLKARNVAKKLNLKHISNKGLERMHGTSQLPEIYQNNIRTAVEILKDAGCGDIFLFGSLAENTVREGSDIDIAVRGCPKTKFFHVLGKLLISLDFSVDLIDLDQDDAFSRFLIEKEELIQIA